MSEQRPVANRLDDPVLADHVLDEFDGSNHNRLAHRYAVPLAWVYITIAASRPSLASLNNLDALAPVFEPVVHQYQSSCIATPQAKASFSKKRCKPMHPADINSALIKKGSNQTIIAEELSVSIQAVSHVIHGRSTSQRVAEAVSKATGISISRLWPGRYPRQTRHTRKAAA